MFDLPTQESFMPLLPTFYRGTNAFIICFSLISPSSLESVKNRWVPDIKKYNPDAPLILAGVHSDLRDEFNQHPELQDQDNEPVPKEKGEEMKELIKAECYIECSLQKNYNVVEVFEQAIKCAIHSNPINPTKSEPAKKEKESKKSKKGFFKIFGKKMRFT